MFMICNKCGQEMPEIGTFCPFCGAPKSAEEETVSLAAEETAGVSAEEIAEEIAEETAEETVEETVEESAEETDEEITEEVTEEPAPGRKLKLWQLIAIIAGGIVLLAILAGAVLYAMGVRWSDLKPRQNDLYYKDSYTAEDEDIVKKGDQVIATLGSEELTIAELQLYYTNDVYTFLNNYYSYLSYFGLDLTLPLDEQAYPIAENEQTWQQYFLETALSSWQNYALLQMLMEQDGYVASEGLLAEMESIPEQLESLAVSYGYENAQAYLEDQMSPGITMDLYMEFNRDYYTSSEYLDQCYAQLMPTAEEIEAYYLENQQTFEENGTVPEMGLQSSVRHILIQPEGGTTDENNKTVYSDEEMAAAYAEAERILQEWKAGAATEESFAELANTYSQDGGSNTTGGLYELINIDASYVAEFREWAVDANRQVGDTAIVETEFGYHIMYFVSGEDYFTYIVREQLIAQRIQDKLTAAQEEYPMEVNYKKIALYAPNFG